MMNGVLLTRRQDRGVTGHLRVFAAMLLFSVGAFTPSRGEDDLHNTLQDHGSPYLRLHERDPVAWQQWDASVMALARRQNKLVFVSIGYFSCHWCHVMQRESFSDQGIARQLNRHFIPVKVDRELNPALDAYLIEFVQRTRGTAGWPLNVIISPQGYPVVGITYLPKAQLSQVLQQTALVWRQNGEFIQQMSRNAAQQLRGEKKLQGKPVTVKFAQKLSNDFLQQALQVSDELSGGFGDQSKFPMAPQLNALLNQYQRNPQEQLKAFLELTLDQMATQGMRDHIGGGFFRYTVNPTWQTPHFEKMLYDNASLASLYLRAATVLQRPDYAGVARETLRFMLRELQLDNGAMATSLSAVDDHDVEGGYYLWQAQTLKKRLADNEYEVLYLLWGMEHKAQFEAGYLPRHAMSPDDVAKALGKPLDEVMQIIARAQGKLFKARQQRFVPMDNKQLAGWNGLVLQALSEAAQGPGGKEFRVAARQVRNYLVNELWNGETLLRAKDRQQGLGEGLLEDYVFAAQGLWHWYRLSGDDRDLQLVKRWVDTAWQRFYGDTGWLFTDRPLLPGHYGNAVIEDAPLPSLSAALIQLSGQLAQQDGNKSLREKVKRALGLGHDLMRDNPFSYPSQIEAMLDYAASREPITAKP